jgi:hypothetical protein
MKKRRRQLERNPKNRETQKTITKNLKKKLKKIFTKKKRGGEPPAETSRHPLPFF